MCVLRQTLVDDDEMKKDGMGRACGTNGGGEKYIQNFGWETSRRETCCET